VPYSILPSFVLGFHGCDLAVARRVVAKQEQLRFSENVYDWLGSGIYFWENSPERALEWASLLRKRKRVKQPAVIGAVIDLGQCLDLLDRSNIKMVRLAYEELVAASQQTGAQLPANRPLKKSRDLLLRDLDCAVINTLHQLNVNRGLPSYDSVRAVFVEGEPIYSTSAFHDRNHIQICVRNLACIKGYFFPFDEDASGVIFPS
jgi:hypothetical protein